MRRISILAAVGILLSFGAFTFHGNVPGEATLSVSDGTISIEYTGPEYKGRNIDEAIKQPGANPWRLGADRATVLKTPVDLKFDDSVLPAGQYTLRAYLDSDDGWWLQAYDSSRSVVAKLRLKRSTAEDSADHLKISLTGSPDAASVHVQWGPHKLSGQFSVSE